MSKIPAGGGPVRGKRLQFPDQVFEGFCELFNFILAFQGVGRGWLVGGKLELKLNDGNTFSLAIICGQMKT